MLNEGRRPLDYSDQDVKYGNNEWLEKQWSYFNKKFFGGKLKKPRMIIWDKNRSGRLGCCGADFNGKEYYTTHIKISTRNENYISVKNTLVHEMVHQWVNETYVTDDVIKAANAYGMARCRPWWNYINKCKGAGTDGHHGTWLTKCEEIMKLDPTLILSKYGTTDETKLSDKEVEEYVKKHKTAHAVVQEGSQRSSRRHFYIITDECYNDLVKSIQDGTKDGQWFEYEFDAERMAQEKIKTMSYIGNTYYNGSYFDNLCERDIIKEWTKKNLGGTKTVHHRRTRSWW